MARNYNKKSADNQKIIIGIGLNLNKIVAENEVENLPSGNVISTTTYVGKPLINTSLLFECDKNVFEEAKNALPDGCINLSKLYGKIYPIMYTIHSINIEPSSNANYKKLDLKSSTALKAFSNNMQKLDFKELHYVINAPDERCVKIVDGIIGHSFIEDISKYKNNIIESLNNLDDHKTSDVYLDIYIDDKQKFKSAIKSMKLLDKWCKNQDTEKVLYYNASNDVEEAKEKVFVEYHPVDTNRINIMSDKKISSNIEAAIWGHIQNFDPNISESDKDRYMLEIFNPNIKSRAIAVENCDKYEGCEYLMAEWECFEMKLDELDSIIKH